MPANHRVQVASPFLSERLRRLKRGVAPLLPLLRPAQQQADQRLRNLGIRALSAGRPNAAERWLGLSLVVKEQNVPSWLWLAETHRLSGNTADAVAAAEHALSCHGHPEASLESDTFTTGDGGPLGCTGPADWALQGGGLPRERMRRLQQDLARVGAQEGAVSLARIGRSADPSDPHWLSEELSGLVQLGRFTAADQLLGFRGTERLTQRGQLAAARVDIERGRPVAAHRRLAAMPEAAVPVDDLVRLTAHLRDHGRIDLAQIADRRARRIAGAQPRNGQPFNPAEARLLGVAGNAAYRAGDFEAATAWFEMLTTTSEGEPWPWLWLSRTYRKAGQSTRAKDAAERALVLDEAFIEAWQDLAALNAELGEVRDAVAAWWRVDEHSGTDAGRRLQAAGALEALGALEEALRIVESVLASDAWNAEALIARHRLLGRCGRRDDQKAIVEGLRADRRPQANATLIAVLTATDLPTALNELRALDPIDWDPKLVQRLASLLKDAGSYSRACALLRQALAAQPHRSLTTQLRRLEETLYRLQGAAVPPVGPVPRVEGVRGRILHVVKKSLPYTTSGYTIRTKDIVDSQRQVGLGPSVVTGVGFPWSEGLASPPLHEIVEHVDHYRVPPPASPMLSPAGQALRRAVEVIQDVRPSVLHAASDYENAVVALELGRRFGLPVVYEVRGLWEETWLTKDPLRTRDAEFYRLRKQRETEAMMAADHIVTLGTALRADLVARGIDKDRISVVPNAVDPDVFSNPERDNRLAQRWGLADDHLTLGYITSLNDYEGIDTLLEAAARLRAEGYRLQVLVVGEGAIRARLQTRAAALGIADHCVFTGAVPHRQVASYYTLIDVFVVPRTAQRVCELVPPLKPYEAMAAGRPLIMSDLPALREIVEDGVTGLVFEPENPNALADRIVWLYDDEHRRQTMGRAAAEAVRRDHTWERNAHRYLEIYEALGVL